MGKKSILEDNKSCATCEKASPIQVTGDYICPSKGVVAPDFSCCRYSRNFFLKNPPKRRMIDSNRYENDDFSLNNSSN